MTGIFLLIGSLALVRSPPFNIFLSKFTIFSAGMRSGYVWLMIGCLLFLAIVFAAFLRMISSSVFGAQPENIPQGEKRWSTLAPLAGFVVLILALGLYLPPQMTILLNQAASIATTGDQMVVAKEFMLGLGNTSIPGMIFQTFLP